ncbi:hypothetical protein SLEP1_g6794 [Rubroshorea leprosula]|uniref:Uncharacterized protein n=1 Tax=Rubroshorea leprosula TaxID=152421 RepID=A0AAV5I0X8_9ROSI|nr:hypothetical protein SLEP1_g6794 [Rubroshorea leprosula]
MGVRIALVFLISMSFPADPVGPSPKLQSNFCWGNSGSEIEDGKATGSDEVEG